MMKEQVIQLVWPEDDVNTAFFLDGSGSCCAAVLDYHLQLGDKSPIKPKVIVTSGLEGNKTALRTEEFREKGISLEKYIDADIAGFYSKMGHFTPKSVKAGNPKPWITLKNDRGRILRDSWTEERLISPLTELDIALGVFGGFEPLTNIVGVIPCLNTHPGDLTYLKAGERYLVGWMTMPVERAILEGHKELKTTVILAMPYDPQNPLADMDNGVIIGLSAGVPIDLYGHSIGELRKIAELRSKQRPREGYNDALEEIASKNQNSLKHGGDYIALPGTTMDVAAGHLAVTAFSDSKAKLLFLENPNDPDFAMEISHVVYHKSASGIIEREIIKKAA